MASSSPISRKRLDLWVIGTWAAQILVAVVFLSSAWLKLTTPSAELALMMPWTATVPAGFVTFIGLVDLAGALGLILPALTGIFPRLTSLAALGCAAVQIFGGSLHAWRGELAQTPLNLLLLALCLFILWSRERRR